MSNPFTAFLGGVVGGIFGSKGDLRDYQHANRLYVQNTYARAPKHGFLYFVSFSINPNAVRNTRWRDLVMRDVGTLVKKIDLPKFQIKTETVNQYNRKTVVQTGLTYQPVTIDFHDDNSDITRELWANYYKFYYSDSVYGDLSSGQTKKGAATPAYGDTKFGSTDYMYGFNNYTVDGAGNPIAPFFSTIDIYVLHQQQFSQFTLVNPIVTDWAHDSLEQDQGGKVLSSKMTVAYENVFYNQGKIVKSGKPENFSAIWYDTQPSPLSISGNGVSSLFGPGGVINGAASIFGENGSLANALNTGNPLDYLKVAIQGGNLAKNIGSLSKAGLQQEGYSIATGVLGNIAATGNQPGGVNAAIQNSLNQQGITGQNNVGINLFSNQNSSVNGQTSAKPSTLTGR